MKRKKGELLAFIAQRAKKSREAFTLAVNMMAWPSAVHTLGACLTAAVPKKPRRTDWNENEGEETRGKKSKGH